MSKASLPLPIKAQKLDTKLSQVSQADSPTNETKTAIAQPPDQPRCGVRRFADGENTDNHM